jgi:hypothetical protein
VNHSISQTATSFFNSLLELDRLVLSRFEGSETIANAAFQALVDRYGGKPLAEYASAPQEIDLN